MSGTETPDTFKARPSLISVIGYGLMAATFIAVPLEVGPAISEGLQLTGRAAMIGYALAICFDLVWIGALSKVPSALRQGDRPALLASLGVALSGAAASIVGVAALGIMPVLAAVPAVALAIHGLGMFLDTRLADQATDEAIVTARRVDRNRVALARQGARTLATSRALLASAHVAEVTGDLMDRTALSVALNETLALNEVQLKASSAKAESAVAKVGKKQDAKAAAWAQRGLSADVIGQPALPSTPEADVIEAATVTVDAELAAVRSERIILDEDDDVTAVMDSVMAPVTVSLVKAPVSLVKAPAAAPSATVAAMDTQKTNTQVTSTRRTAGKVSPLAASQAARSKRKAEGVAAIIADGLTTAQVVARYGVSAGTARLWVRAAKAATA